MNNTWVLVADEAIARLLDKPQQGTLTPVETLTDADAHAREGEFQRAPHGRRGGAETGGAQATVAAGDAERHQHAQVFAARVAQRLDDCLREQRFATLHVVAAPRMLGYLRGAFSPAVAAAVARTLDKEVVHESEAELTRRLFNPASAG